MMLIRYINTWVKYYPQTLFIYFITGFDKQSKFNKCTPKPNDRTCVPIHSITLRFTCLITPYCSSPSYLCQWHLCIMFSRSVFTNRYAYPGMLKQFTRIYFALAVVHCFNFILIGSKTIRTLFQLHFNGLYSYNRNIILNFYLPGIKFIANVIGQIGT